MTTDHAAPRSRGRIFRALAAYSAHTAETYVTVWGPGRSTAPSRLTEPVRF